MKIFTNTAYALLREQKQTLLNVAATTHLTKQEREHLDGIINFLDAFQDAAVSEGGIPKEEVFDEGELGWININH